MSLKLLTYEDFSLPYRQYGQGKEVFLAFHGFGRSGTDFQIFEEAKKHDWTIIAFDWFFHNEQAAYPMHRIEKNAITKKEFAEIIKKLMHELGIDKVGLMAHSMGGKYVMSAVEEIPELTSGVYLFAADGLKINFWNHFAVRSRVGRKVFKSAVKNPKTVIRFADLMHRLGVLNDKTHAVTIQPLESQLKREQVFNTWTSSLNLFPNSRRFVDEVKRHNIELIAFYGKKDQIIRLNDTPKWVNEFEYEVVHAIDAGHLLLKEKHVNAILERIDR